MFLGKIIGTVVATRKDENLVGVRLVIVQPLDHRRRAVGEPLVAADTVNAGRGQMVFLVSRREAAEALPKAYGPIDAAVVGMVDQLNAHT